MASRWRILAAKLAIRLEVTRGMIFSLKDCLIGQSRGSIIDCSFRAEVRVNQSMEHHLRMGEAEIVSLDLFSMSLNELQLTLHSQISGLTAGRDLDAHLK
jgi:hypothetical protein